METDSKKVKDNTSNKSKKFSKGVIVWSASAILALGGIITIGYLSPKIPKNVDFITTGSSSNSATLNFITQPGNTTKFTLPIMESFITPRTKEDPNSVNKQWMDHIIADNNAPIDEKEIDENVSKAIVERDKPLEIFVPNSNAAWNLNGVLDETDGYYEEDKEFTLAQAEQIIMDNKSMKQMTIFLRDDIYFSNESDWKSKDVPINANYQDIVKPSDFVYASQLLFDVTNGAANSYIFSKYFNLNNVKDGMKKQAEGKTIAESFGDPNATDVFHKEWGKVMWNLDIEDLPGGTDEHLSDFQQSPDDKPAMVFSDTDRIIQYNLDLASSYFYSLFVNNIFWPVNQDWYKEKIGTEPGDILIHGSTAEHIMSNGPYYVDDFDPNYGTFFSKNENFYAADAVISDRWMYRVAEETTQQALLFKQGYSSYTMLQDGASSFLEDPELKKFVQPGVDIIQTRYTFFNLSDPINHPGYSTEWTDGNQESGSYKPETRIFTQNKNFRKALGYVFNREHGFGLAGLDDSLPSKTFTGSGMGTLDLTKLPSEPDFSWETTSTFESQGDNGGTYAPIDNYTEYIKGESTIDFVDLAALYAIDESDQSTNETLQKNGVGINQWPKELRTESLSDATQNRNKFEKYQKEARAGINDLIEHYWEAFEGDMAKEGVAIPNPINLTYVTPDANNDVWYKGIQNSIQNSPLNGKITIEPLTKPGGSFWSAYWSGEYDLMTLRWSPDFQDPWAFLSLFSNYDYSRQGNNLAVWKALTGTKQDPSAEHYSEGIEDLLGKDSKETDEDYQDLIFGKDPFGLDKPQWTDQDGNTELTIPEIMYGLYDEAPIDPKLQETYEERKQFNSTKFFGLEHEIRYMVMLLMEVLVLDSSAIYVHHAEISTQNASRLFNKYNSSTSYEDYTMAYDIRNSKYGLPGEEEFLKWISGTS